LNKIQYDHLEILETLGAGSQGKVKKARHRETGELFAVKYIPAGDDNPDVLLRELQCIENRPHPNVVSSREAYFRSSKLLIVLEFMDCGTMSMQLKKRKSGFPEEIVAFVAKCLLQGLVHLHQQRIVHRDIKPANLLCNAAGEVKISDFGVAAFLGSKLVQQTTSSVGSTPYMSPERVAGKAYSFESDVWSAGVTMAECLMGNYPFGIDLKGNIFRLCERIVDMNLTIDWPAGVSDDAKDFINQCLRASDSRPSAEKLLTHKFIDKCASLSAEDIGKFFSS
jgi:mitogen-activated protein kinase kinase 1